MTQAANLAALGTNASSTGILPAAGGGTAGTAGVTGFKNRLINGAMVIDQRNAGATVTPTTNAQYTLDRWNFELSAASKFSTQQSSTAPTGFSNSLLVTSLSPYSSSAGDYFCLRQQIEGYNVADLSWGTAGAAPVTLSFWVRSSLTGSFGGSIICTGGSNYSYPFLYTISAANTWTQISVSVPANTFNAPNAGNASAVEVCFNLGTGTTYSGTAGAWASGYKISATGATSVLATSGATWYVTGVQLEVGTAATNFDVRSYGTEFFLCQRYFQVYYSPADFCHIWTGYVANDGAAQYLGVPFAVPMRAIPTGTITSYNTSAFGVPSLQLVSTSFIRASATPTGQNNRAYFQFNSTYSAEL